MSVLLSGGLQLTGAILCFKVKADEDSPLGRLLQKTVSTVMSDFQSMMELKDFVRQVDMIILLL